MIPWVKSIAEVRQAVGEARARGLRIGLVPTMGALHDGHVHLIERCRAAADFVVVSIFVNPTQFGPSEDFTRYPRTPELDRDRAASGGADLIFGPTAEEMYPHGPNSTCVEVVPFAGIFEGAIRPGHFRGVATVVLKLFSIVEPDLACFGQKDFQQQCVIRRMAEDLNLRLSIQIVETVREPDGLALSSRNRYLDSDQRRGAVVLPRALKKAQAAVAGGVRDAERVRQILHDTINSEPMAQLDYAEVVDAETLGVLTGLEAGRTAVALLAVRFGATRLIDNAFLPE
ncbi:pantoate--beta-alanine ligase [Singulisphaera sp. GP187]|uniref:pantoate--beta-alanine ligase n=1 Tax=Singulisphaera sp. GP187 TaxID=1882752 RepID=UPI000928B442|nr:pantoate--beta-alanine ligase [Singulisphaera sp. GP187]SIN85066.1 pantoate--beta-alanine ligase [Singulisphaera sp. GP187]